MADPAGPEPVEDPPVPVPPDPADPLERDEDEDHPGMDPVTRPIPPD